MKRRKNAAKYSTNTEFLMLFQLNTTSCHYVDKNDFSSPAQKKKSFCQFRVYNSAKMWKIFVPFSIVGNEGEVEGMRGKGKALLGRLSNELQQKEIPVFP